MSPVRRWVAILLIYVAVLMVIDMALEAVGLDPAHLPWWALLIWGGGLATIYNRIGATVDRYHKRRQP